MKTTRFLLALLCVVAFSFSVFSQNTFENKFHTDEESEFRFVKETSNGDFILLYHSSNKSDCIVKLSSAGESINTLCHQIPEGNIYFFGLFEHPEYEDSYIAPAMISNNSVRNKIALLSFDINLNIIDVNTISFEEDVLNYSDDQIPIAIIKGDNIIFASLVELLSGDYAHLFANVNINGTLEECHIDTSFSYTSRSFPSDFAIINDEGTQYSYCYFKDYPNDISDGFNRKLVLVICDDKFKPIYTKEFESFYDYEYDEQGICGYKVFTFVDLPKFRKLNDTTLLLQILANNMSDDGVAYIKFNKELEVIDDKFIIKKGDGDIRLPLVNSIEINNDYIVDCKIKKSEDFNPDYISEIIVSKYDHELNLIWENTINQGYYRPMYLLSTSDNGYLLAGSCNDNNENYLYVTKTDAEGVLSIEEESVDNMSFSIYPNPAKDNISIAFSNNTECDKLEIYSVDGKLCLEICHDFEAIDISTLNNGIYMIKALFDDGNQYIKKLIVK